MSSVSEFEINLKLLNEVIVKIKSDYNNQTKKFLMNKTIFDIMIELQALAIYVEKSSTNQPSKDDDFDVQVWNILKKIENEGTATDIAQSQFNKLFTEHEEDILTIAKNV